MLPYVFLALYLIAAVFNLIGTREGRGKLFAVTKPMLILLLCLYCFLKTLPSPDRMLIAAFAACWVGDILLMLKGDLWFTVGGISFFAGHVLLIFVFAREADLGSAPIAVLIVASAVYAAAASLVMARAGGGAPVIMRVPMFMYLMVNGVTNVFALSRLFASPGIWSALSYAGALLFFLSDCILFLLRYEKGRPRLFKSGFFVMLTYISAVLLIALGLTH